MSGGRKQGHYQVTFTVLTAAIAAYALLQSMVVPVLTTMQAQLHTSQDNATWILTAYLLSASICTPILGRVGDIYGKGRVFVAALIALAVGCVLAALAPNIGVMIAARVIQGIAGGMVPVAFGIIRDEFPPEKVAGAVGSLASLTAVGSGLGIVIAGPIVNALGWQYLFWLPMILTLLAAVAAVIFIPESPVRSPGTISWLPAVLLSGWLVAILVALSEAPVWGWGSPKVIGLLAGGVVIAAVWGLSEVKARTPLIDMKMMRLPTVWTNNLVSLLLGLSMYAMFAFLPEFLQTPRALAGYGFTASIIVSGLMLLPSSATMFVTGQYAGRLAARFGGKALVIWGCAISAVAMFILAFAHSQEWQIAVATGLMGIGFGFAYSAMSALVVAAVPADQTGVATGMNANIRNIGGSIGSAAMASIVTSHLAKNGLPLQSGYTTGFTIMAVGLIFATGAALLIPAARRAVLANTGASGTADTATTVTGGSAVTGDTLATSE
jgi:EmrB/QacA subfamily drug resistance transporter